MADQQTTEYQPLLRQLRSVLPDHPLTLSETLGVLDRLAAGVRQFAGVEGDLLPDSVITQQPSIRVEDSSLPIAGYTYWEPATHQWVIRLAKDDSPGDRRFTLLREFGHIIWHGREHDLFPHLHSAERDRIAASAADLFAVEALMPAKAVRQAYSAGIRDAEVLAKRFGVSATDVRWRLAQLNIAPESVDPSSYGEDVA